MPMELLTADAFRIAAKDGVPPDCRILRATAGEPVQTDDANSNTFRFTCSDASVDLAGDTIKQSGWTNIKEFETKNGVGLWAHDSSAPPIGRWKNMAIASGKLKGDLEFVPEDVYPFAGTLAKLVKGKFLNAVSVGFVPVEWEFAKDKDREFGIDFLKQLLIEVSLCPVPCNQNALIDARSAGIDTGPLSEWAERILDGEGKILIPRSLLEETFRQAKTPRSVRQKYLAKSEGSDWKMGAARDLPLDDTDSWDGPAASKRMLDAAGFDGDSPDTAKAARGFLIHDAANPALRGSYKLPFADIVDGELKAIKGGISAAKGRLDQTDAPAAVLDDAKAVISGYEDKANKSITITLALDASAIVEKAGRKISSANQALLQQAMDHHESATKCIKDVLASNEPDGEPDNDGDENGNNMVVLAAEPTVTIVPVVVEDPRAKRLAEVAALKASIKK
jgi:HK97 family phage prohead protease